MGEIYNFLQVSKNFNKRPAVNIQKFVEREEIVCCVSERERRGYRRIVLLLISGSH